MKPFMITQNKKSHSKDLFGVFFMILLSVLDLKCPRLKCPRFKVS